jgi:uncharacterized membrane protein YkoI
MKIKTLLCSAVAASLVAGCASERQTQSQLEAQAKISKSDAEIIALGQASNGTVKDSELEKEHGKLIWSFDIATPGTQDITEVAVDALNGKVVSVEKETPKQQSKEKD